MTRPSSSTATARAAARLAAVQALYQHDMEGTDAARLLYEFHHHRLGATIEDVAYAEPDVPFFDDVVRGTLVRLAEVDALIAAKLTTGWSLAKLDKSMKAILRCATFEVIGRADVPTAVIVNEYVDVAKAFFDQAQAGFAHGVIDAIARDQRAVPAD